MEEQLLEQIGQLMLEATKNVLSESIPSRAFGGMMKPISGIVPTPYSPKIATGTFINSLTYEIDINPGDGQPYVRIFSTIPDDQNYGKYINDGRANNKRMPPKFAIQSWIASKGIFARPIPTNDRGKIRYRVPTLNQLTFLIQRSIGQYGIFPYPFEQITKERVSNFVRQQVENNIGDFYERLIREQVVYIINPQRRTNL